MVVIYKFNYTYYSYINLFITYNVSKIPPFNLCGMRLEPQ